MVRHVNQAGTGRIAVFNYRLDQVPLATMLSTRAPYLSTSLRPMPGTSRSSSSVVGAWSAMARRVLSGKMVKAGTACFLASSRRQAFRAASRVFVFGSDFASFGGCFAAFLLL